MANYELACSRRSGQWIVDSGGKWRTEENCHVFDSNKHVSEYCISAHAQSVFATDQKHHNSSPLASACNMVTNKDLKR